MPVVIRALFDGKTARPLPGEFIPPIEGEVEVEILLRDARTEQSRQAIERLRQMRTQVPPLDIPLRDLIEEGRRF
ncbi:MAG: hypothetical protein N2554_08855 [Fimbriimonadales bacterium]|nr:hypothetical protein [Fimbriimonadales bacterium]